MRTFALILAAIVVVSCGDDKKSNTTPLTEEQKTKFGETLQSFERTGSATKLAKEIRSRRPFTRDSLDQPQRDVHTMQMGQTMARKCETSVEWNNQSSTPSGTFHLKLGASGAECPVTLKFDVSAQKIETASTLGLDFKAEGNYVVHEVGFKKLNDIYGYEFKGGGPLISVDRQTRKFTSNVDVTGNLLSSKYGSLAFQMASRGEGLIKSQSESEGRIESSYTVKYPDYTAELKMVRIFEGKTQRDEYYLNSETLTKEQFEAWIKKAGLGELNSVR
jgi:hypothetical protein